MRKYKSLRIIDGRKNVKISYHQTLPKCWSSMTVFHLNSSILWILDSWPFLCLQWKYMSKWKHNHNDKWLCCNFSYEEKIRCKNIILFKAFFKYTFLQRSVNLLVKSFLITFFLFWLIKIIKNNSIQYNIHVFYEAEDAYLYVSIFTYSEALVNNTGRHVDINVVVAFES